MSRIIRVENPTTVRNRHLRSIAEILRRLSQKGQMDAEAKDMAAMIVYLLREIDAGVKQSAKAWEKRDYWMKAERFMRDWTWTEETAVNIEDVIRNEAWDLMPDLMADLFPHVSDVKIKKMTRKPSLWHGAYKRLMAEPPSELPW